VGVADGGIKKDKIGPQSSLKLISELGVASTAKEIS